MDFASMISQNPTVYTVLVAICVYLVPQFFKFLIHGKEIRRDEVDKLVKTIEARSNSLDGKIVELEEEVESWRKQYYALVVEHAELKNQCEILRLKVDEMQHEIEEKAKLLKKFKPG